MFWISSSGTRNQKLNWAHRAIWFTVSHEKLISDKPGEGKKKNATASWSFLFRSPQSWVLRLGDSDLVNWLLPERGPRRPDHAAAVWRDESKQILTWANVKSVEKQTRSADIFPSRSHNSTSCVTDYAVVAITEQTGFHFRYSSCLRGLFCLYLTVKICNIWFLICPPQHRLLTSLLSEALTRWGKRQTAQVDK